MNRIRSAALAALVAAPFALAACGGGDDLSSDDQDQITEAIRFAAVSGDPKACTEAQTQDFTEQTSGGTGEAAVKTCEKDAGDTPADSVEVTNIDGDGDSATADATFSGKAFDGQTIEVALVKEDDSWKLDEALGFKDLDRDTLIAGLRSGIESEGGAPPAAVDCVVKNLKGLSDQQIEDLFLSSDTQLQNQVFSSCFQG
jgi:hypothetical protein